MYDLSFHPDGSLAASVGLEAHGRIWDLRQGKCVQTLLGHVKQCLSVDFSPNGYQLARPQPLTTPHFSAQPIKHFLWG